MRSMWLVSLLRLYLPLIPWMYPTLHDGHLWLSPLFVKLISSPTDSSERFSGCCIVATPVHVQFEHTTSNEVGTVFAIIFIFIFIFSSLIFCGRCKKSRRETACCYFLGFPASERLLRILPSLLRSRGWVPPPGLGTTTCGLSGLRSAISIPYCA